MNFRLMFRMLGVVALIIIVWIGGAPLIAYRAPVWAIATFFVAMMLSTYMLFKLTKHGR
jgi:hypothetical protein